MAVVPGVYANITLRLVKGSALTYQELDDNFKFLHDNLGEGGGAANGICIIDADGDTFVCVELSPDEDVIRFATGNTIPGYASVNNIMTLSSSGWFANLGMSINTHGASIEFRAGSGSSNTSSNNIGGSITLRPGPGSNANDGVVAVIGPAANTPSMVRFFDASNAQYTAIQAPEAVASNTVLTLPVDAGSSGQVLATDGLGNLSWSTSAEFSPNGPVFINVVEAQGPPANNEIAFWSSNTFVMGDSRLFYNRANNTLVVSGGSVSATTKNFLIRHPSRDHWLLQYSSLEGPEHGVYVRGESKDSIVPLPWYWDDLVNENSLTASITAVGGPQFLWIEQLNTKQLIVGGSDSPHFHYVIYGTRKDVPSLIVELIDE